MDLWSSLVEVIETGIETEDIELKREQSLSNKPARAEFAKDIAAMANSGHTGYLVVGVMDEKERSGLVGHSYVVGFSPGSVDEILRQMNDALAVYCEPVPKIMYRTLCHPDTGKVLGVVEVFRSFARPHAIRRSGEGVEEHDIWIRGGPACRKATLHEIEEMIRGQRRVILVNFSHPLPTEEVERARLLLNCRIEELIHVPAQFDHGLPFDPQIDALVNRAGLTSRQWQTKPILVNLPGYAPAAAVLVAELHGRMGHFPTILRLCPVPGEGAITYEVEEVVDLQITRDQAREER